MLKLLKSITMIVALAGAACVAQAQTSPPAPAAVTIDAASWLSGRWVGEGLGGQMEEGWSAPAGGQMIGYFRLSREGTPVFYEFIILDVTDAGLRMRLKHFNPDGTSWEERERWTTFEPVSVSADELRFNGLIITRESADTITMRLRLRAGGEVREEVLRFRRAD